MRRRAPLLPKKLASQKAATLAFASAVGQARKSAAPAITVRRSAMAEAARQKSRTQRGRHEINRLAFHRVLLELRVLVLFALLAASAKVKASRSHLRQAAVLNPCWRGRGTCRLYSFGTGRWKLAKFRELRPHCCSRSLATCTHTCLRAKLPPSREDRTPRNLPVSVRTGIHAAAIISARVISTPVGPPYDYDAAAGHDRC